MENVSPKDIVKKCVAVAQKKINKSNAKTFLSAIGAAWFLGFATCLTIQARAQGWTSVAAAMLFPVGFIMLILLGLDLATGSMAVIPMGLAAGKLAFFQLVKNIALVYGPS